MVTPVISVLTKRADFLAANSGIRNARAGFVLLTRSNGGQGIRFGITVTKKIGNAVVRNRMKRRYRALAAAILPERGIAGADHVLIGRPGGNDIVFAELGEQLADADLADLVLLASALQTSQTLQGPLPAQVKLGLEQPLGELRQELAGELQLWKRLLA